MTTTSFAPCARSVRAALILPEVVDESKWWFGQHQYVDPEKRYIFVYVGNVNQYISYNTKLVQPGEIRSYWDFLQPKWKGRMLSRDPKISGSQRIGLRMFYYSPELGAEFIRRLYGETDITITQEMRQATDWLAAGKFAMILYLPAALVETQGMAYIVTLHAVQSLLENDPSRVLEVIVPGGGLLPEGNYRFRVSGSTSIHDLSGLKLDGDGDGIGRGLDGQFGGVDGYVVAQRISRVLAKLATDQSRSLAIGAFDLNVGSFQAQILTGCDPTDPFLDRRNHPHPQTELTGQKVLRPASDDDHASHRRATSRRRSTGAPSRDCASTSWTPRSSCRARP